MMTLQRNAIASVIALALGVLIAPLASAQIPSPPDPDPLPPPLHWQGRYEARGWPQRIVLSPGADAARQMSVAWRTDVRQRTAEAQIAQDIDGPLLEHAARTITGQTSTISNENGAAHYHQVRFAALEPGTRYVYRVRGAEGWSEWLPFTTAQASFQPFRFIYLGDTQNDILSVGSRVIRAAFQHAGPVALTLHAGDLVAQREVVVHDDEWGQWSEAGGHHFAMVPQAPAAGNHEYVDHILPNGEEQRVLGPHWPLQFALPQNGAEGARQTSYYFDYQGVRFVILDGTAARDLGALETQARWLDAALASNPGRWSVAVFHQPIYTCARLNDTEELKAVWRPILENRRVDLVLQGHDHCYGRVSHEGGRASSARASEAGQVQGPVYVVSVTGSKMYGLNDRADTQPVRAAENTELYQIVDVEADQIRFRAYTATGALYDDFSLLRGVDGRNRLREHGGLINERRCDGAAGPDDRPCTAEIKD